MNLTVQRLTDYERELRKTKLKVDKSKIICQHENLLSEEISRCNKRKLKATLKEKEIMYLFV